MGRCKDCKCFILQCLFGERCRRCTVLCTLQETEELNNSGNEDNLRNNTTRNENAIPDVSSDENATILVEGVLTSVKLVAASDSVPTPNGSIHETKQSPHRSSVELEGTDPQTPVDESICEMRGTIAPPSESDATPVRDISPATSDGTYETIYTPVVGASNKHGMIPRQKTVVYLHRWGFDPEGMLAYLRITRPKRLNPNEGEQNTSDGPDWLMAQLVLMVQMG